MTRINCFSSASKIAENKIAVRKISESRKSITWGKNTGALMFAALLIVCSLTVGCNSDKPKPVSSNNQIPVTQNPTPDTMISSNTPAPAGSAREAGSEESSQEASRDCHVCGSELWRYV